MDLRDTILPQTQEMLDELTTMLHDTVNAIHERGTSYKPQTTLTGQHIIPGADNTERDTVALSATGTLRVAVMNNADNKVIAYHDLDVSTVTNVADFRNDFNAAIQPTVAGFDMRLSATGTLEITSGSPSMGVALTSIGPEAIETETGKGIADYFRLSEFYTVADPLPPTTVTGTVVGFQDTDAFNFTSTLQIAVLDKTTGAVVDSHDLDLNTPPSGINDIAVLRGAFNTAIQPTVAGFDMRLTAGGTLEITSGDANLGIQITSLNALATDVGTGISFPKTFGLEPSIPLMRGAANSLHVNPDLVQEPSHIARGILTDGVITPGNTEGIASGDARIAEQMKDLHSVTHNFARAGALNPVDATLESYASSILGSESTSAAIATDTFKNAESLQKQSLEKYLDYSGVDVEKAMTDFMDTTFWNNAILAFMQGIFRAQKQLLAVAAA